MKTGKLITVLLAFLGIFAVFSYCSKSGIKSGINGENKEARKIAEAELQKYLIQCETHRYVIVKEKKDTSAGSIATSVVLNIYELNQEPKGEIKYQEFIVPESDKLNGIEYRGDLYFYYNGPFRTRDRYREGEKLVEWAPWTPWHEGQFNFHVFIDKINGTWKMELKIGYDAGTCSEVAAILNSLK
jgi:hypothetical protein